MNWEEIQNWAGSEFVSMLEEICWNLGMDRDGWREIPAFKTSLVTLAIINCTVNHSGSYEKAPWTPEDIRYTFKVLGYDEGTTPESWLSKFKAWIRHSKARSKHEMEAFHKELNRRDAEDLEESRRSQGLA